MCGIAGVLTTVPAEAGRTAVPRMAARLSHRGPSGTGEWQSASACAILANTRLAIFDPTPAAAQPMTIEGGRFAITYNGAIYNHRELRARLERGGVRFRTDSDTEVILRGYEHYGPSVTDHLEGMYALAIWDDQARTGFLARDPFGIKPLYYASAGGDLVFASELRAIAASRLVPLDLDPSAAYGYFRQGSVAEPRTLLRAARMLPAGATAMWHQGSIQITAPAPCPWPEPEAVGDRFAERTRAALLASIDRHFAGDVPVGVLLSGGMDSAALVALAKAAGHDGFPTFSLSYPGEAQDEGADAKRSAAHFGVVHHVLAVDAATGAAALSDHLSAIDQPSIDGLNTFVAARFARAHGISVLLSGIGADEHFGGYGSFWRVPALERWHRLAAAAGPLASWTGALLQGSASSPKVRRVGDLLQQAPSLDHAYNTFRGIFTRAESRALVRSMTGAELLEDDRRQDPPGDFDAQDAVGFMELTRYVRNQLLRDGDVMSMASGVELRTPFLDRGLASVLWSIPSSARVRRSKALLTAAVPEIPAWAIAEPKRCFQFPFDRWLGGEWRDVFASIERASPAPLETWYRKWCLLSWRHAVHNLSEANRA
jgi:asparagine synthase (glutamine-hydrolysing)